MKPHRGVDVARQESDRTAVTQRLPEGSEVLAYLPPGVHPSPGFLLILAGASAAKRGPLSEEEVLALMPVPSETIS